MSHEIPYSEPTLASIWSLVVILKAIEGCRIASYAYMPSVSTA